MKYQNPWKSDLTSFERKLIEKELAVIPKKAESDLDEVHYEIKKSVHLLQKQPNSFKEVQPHKVKHTPRSDNSIEREIKEMEVLKIMRTTDFVAFSKFVNQKVHPKIFKEWHQQIAFRHEMENAKRDNLRNDLFEENKGTFKPEINENSRRLANQWRDKARQRSANKAKKQERVQTPEVVQRRVFTDQEFQQHIAKIDLWNRKAKQRLIAQETHNLGGGVNATIS